MKDDLHTLDQLAQELSRRARAAGMMLIWRAQTRSVRRAVVRKGRAESISATSISGHGAQLVTAQGRTVLGSRDDFEPQAATSLVERLIETAGKAEQLGVRGTPLPELPVTRGTRVAQGIDEHERIDLAAITPRLAEFESELESQVPGVTCSVRFSADRDSWRIFRSDGSDVRFTMSRCALGMTATTAGEGARHGVSANVAHPRPGLAWQDDTVELFLKRAGRAARLARELPDAPPHPAGSFPLVIDYALAKGLAHEAFGHAAEADGFRSSILARDGRFKSGEEVGASHVSIIDEPVEGDHAWQPYSANGLPRERATLVDHGKLCDGLSDPWSAGPGGVRLTGAARAESFRHAPQPRMTNIRLEVDAPLPAPGHFEDYTPEDVRELLAGAGVFRRHPHVVYLSGYAGGQVNTASGDFVFNCKAIYDLGPDGVKMYKPAIFSGSMFGALHAVREAFGELNLDAIGLCGKWGQSVPSSGGSHAFIVLEPDPTVLLGGR